MSVPKSNLETAWQHCFSESRWSQHDQKLHSKSIFCDVALNLKHLIPGQLTIYCLEDTFERYVKYLSESYEKLNYYSEMEAIWMLVKRQLAKVAILMNFTWAVVARYFLSFIVLILSGCCRPGHSAVTFFMADHALIGAVGVLQVLEKNLSIEYGFPSRTHLMGILYIHLMIFSPECKHLIHWTLGKVVYSQLQDSANNLHYIS